MMVPVALAFLFTINQWAKNESGWKKKLITLPLLLLQLYPPFTALRLVVYLITRNSKWFDANKIYNQSVASIEPFLESVPQMHVLLVIGLGSLRVRPGQSQTNN